MRKEDRQKRNKTSKHNILSIGIRFFSPIVVSFAPLPLAMFNCLPVILPVLFT